MLSKNKPVNNIGAYCALMIAAVCSALLYSGKDPGAFSAMLIICAALAAAAVFINSVCIKTNTALSLPLKILFFFLFIAAGAIMLTNFSLFLAQFTKIDLRFYSFIAAILIVCAYASKCGATAILRSCIPLFAMCSIFDLMLIISLAVHLRTDNVAFAFHKADFSPEALLQAAPSALLPLVLIPAVLLSDRHAVSPKPALPILLGASFLVSSVLAAMSHAVLGSTAELSPFPIYTALRASGGTFLRSDMFFLCRQVIGIFVILSFLLSGLKKTVSSVTIPTILIFLIAAGALNSYAIRYILFSPIAVIWIALISILLLPAAAIIRGAYIDTKKVVLPLLILPVIMLSGCSKIAMNEIPCVAYIIPISIIAGIILILKPKLRKTAALLLCVLFVTVTITACDDMQLQSRMIVKGIGIDQDGSDYKISVQYIDNYSDGDKHKNRTISVKGSSVSEALAQLRSASGSDAFFGQLEAVVLSKSVFEDRLYPSLDYILRYSEAVPSARLYVSEKSAEEILKFSKEDAIEPIEHLSTIYPTESKNDVRFTVLGAMDQLLTEGAVPYACMITKEEDAIRLNRAVYLTNGKAHIMTDDEYLTFCILNSLRSESTLRTGKLVCESVFSDTKLKVKENCLFADTKVQFETLENGDNLDNAEQEQEIENYLKELTEKNARKLLNSKRADVFGLSKKYGKDLTDKLGAMDVVVSVSAKTY